MNHAKLLPSQELVLHQVSVDSFSPSTASVLKYPTSPLLPRSTFSDPSIASASSPSIPCSPLTNTNTSAAPSIVRPRIRQRDEWESSLVDVDKFVLDSHSLFTSTLHRPEPVSVRYIADKYDLAWLSRRSMLVARRDDGVVSVVRGKTGVAGCYMSTMSILSMSVLEDTFTALELAAYAHPEVPLERLLLYARPLLSEKDLGEDVLGELHAYWLLRRSGTGGLIPSIPDLRVTIREDNEMALCHPAVLRDCPLPFKQRDWYVPVIKRRPPTSSENGYSLKRSRADTSTGSGSISSLASQLTACELFTEKALSLSRAMLRRETLRQAHMQLTLYELASLRSVVSETRDECDAAQQSLPTLTLSRYLVALMPPLQSETELNCHTD